MHGTVHVPGEMSTMNLRPFPAESRMRWRRLDVPGREEARVVRTPAGWRRESWQSSVGSLEFEAWRLAGADKKAGEVFDTDFDFDEILPALGIR